MISVSRVRADPAGEIVDDGLVPARCVGNCVVSQSGGGFALQEDQEDRDHGEDDLHYGHAEQKARADRVRVQLVMEATREGDVGEGEETWPTLPHR